MREWSYKTDESGRPRRFLGHREAALWAALKIGRLVGKYAAGPLLGIGAATLYLDPERVGWNVVLPLAALVVAFCVLGAVGIYLYVALSGGIMARDERRDYRERLHEARRGRW